MSYVIPKKIDSLSKIVVDDMCSFLKKDSIKLFGFEPFEISRDRDGHILLFENDDNSSNIYCHMIGYNKSSRLFTDYIVGEIDYLEHNRNTVLLMRVAIHPAFQSKGIGRIMYQAAENLFVTKNINHIDLCSLVTYRNITDNYYESTQEILEDYGYTEGQEYIKNNYFDTNLFFYRSLGFVPQSRIYATSIPLEKNDLEIVNIKYGINPINRNLVKTLSYSLGDIIPESYDPYEYLENHQPSLLFDLDLNNYPSEYFHPLKFPATFYGYEKLLNILTQGLFVKNTSQPSMPFLAYSNYCYNDENEEYNKMPYAKTKNKKIIDELLSQLELKIEKLEDIYQK